MDATIFVAIVWNFASSFGSSKKFAGFVNNLFNPILGPIKLKNGNFCHFLPFSAPFTEHIRQKIKIKKIAAECFKKGLSKANIQKMKVLAKILRPPDFSQNSMLKITYISNIWKTPENTIS